MAWVPRHHILRALDQNIDVKNVSLRFLKIFAMFLTFFNVFLFFPTFFISKNVHWNAYQELWQALLEPHKQINRSQWR